MRSGSIVLVPLMRDVCKEGTRRACYNGPDGTKGKGICRSGTQLCHQGQFGPCKGAILPAKQESCNGKDDNCDGKIDNRKDGAFAKKGSACSIKVDACQMADTWVCASLKKLACKQKKEQLAKPGRVMLAISTSNVSIRIGGSSYKAKKSFCVDIPAKKTMTLRFRKRGYHQCRVRLRASKRNKKRFIKLRSSHNDPIEPKLSYCLW